MKQLMAAFTIALGLLAFHGAAWAECTTHTYMGGGRTVVCTTCCLGGMCTTTCF